MSLVDPKKGIFVLLQLTERLTDGRPLEDALRAVTDAALQLLPGDHASIRLLDGSRTHLLASARSGKGTDQRSLLMKRGEGIIGWVVDTGTPARVLDVSQDARFKVATGQGFQVRSIVAEPLWSAGKIIGVLSVSSPDVGAFSGDDELLARLLANCSVPPIERARLERLSVTDDTTLAFNSRYLLPRLHEELERARRNAGTVSLLLMDLDHFKKVNDTHGHAVGDKVLRVFCERVREHTRRVDILVRRGGEEFVLVMPATGTDQAEVTADRVRRHVAESPIDAGEGASVEQTVSVGVATWDGRETPDELERRADLAMYEAKQLGRNRVAIAKSASQV
jgi:diguanylate cyclase (GGDEF)-like protein